MKDYVLHKTGNSPSETNETVWAFDLGKGSIGFAPPNFQLLVASKPGEDESTTNS